MMDIRSPSSGRSRKTVSDIRFRKRGIDLLPSLLPPANSGYSLNRDFSPPPCHKTSQKVSAADHPINCISSPKFIYPGEKRAIRIKLGMVDRSPCLRSAPPTE